MITPAFMRLGNLDTAAQLGSGFYTPALLLNNDIL